MDVRKNEGTTSTEGSDEFDEDSFRCSIYYPADMSKSDIVERYIHVAKKLGRRIDVFHKKTILEYYDFPPVLVASEVDEEILNELPSLIDAYHIKAVIYSGSLYITNMSTGAPHSAGVIELTRQASNWSRRSGFQVKSDNTRRFGNHTSAPDLVLEVSAGYDLGGNSNPSRVVIMELEVSNRSIIRMRQDYLKYFDEPSVWSVVCIKLIEGDRYSPCQRAVAVRWTRQLGGHDIVVDGVQDFGVLKISPWAISQFHLPPQPVNREVPGLLPDVDRLPSVECNAWAQSRHEPIPLAVLALSGDMDNTAIVRAAENFVHGLTPPEHADEILYGGVAPTYTFDGQTLRAMLRNLPLNFPVASPNFVIDLGKVFYEAQRGVSLRPGAPLPNA